MTDLRLSSVFFQALNTPNSFSAGAQPRTPLGSLRRSPRHPSRLGLGGHPLPIPSPPRRLRRLDRLACQAPPTQIPGYAYDRVGAHIAPTHLPI